jgi:hypothetical protein
MDDRDGPPAIAVPARLDRALRLGPFPSARDAAKFVAAAAVAAVASLALTPWAGLPIVAVGAVVALWRPDGEPLDERAAAVGRWLARHRGASAAGEAGMTRRSVGPWRHAVLPDGRRAEVLRTGGLPLAYLPPAEMALQFARFRDLLRSLPAGLVVAATSAPIHAGSVVPTPPTVSAAEAPALAGYRELVTLLARRRSVRRVLLALPESSAGPDGLAQLETAADLLRGRLADLGLRCEPLRDAPLAEAVRRLGWELARGPP